MFCPSPDEILRHGLAMVGFDDKRQARVRRETNLECFLSFFGSLPKVVSLLWERLQTTSSDEARIKAKGVKDLSYFLQALHFLRCYPTEDQRAGTHKNCQRTCREKTWFFLKKIQALKNEVVSVLCFDVGLVVHNLLNFIFQIVWPEDWAQFDDGDAPVLLYSVDGVHFEICEPFHPLYSKNTRYYSHKFHKAALTYEIALALFEDKIIWMHGPERAAKHNITMFRSGLRDKAGRGILGVGDRGFRGEPDHLSTPNSFDPEELSKFKSQASAHQETVNNRMKTFQCLQQRWRHAVSKHQIVFEACIVIVQLQFDCGSPLFRL